MSRLVTALKRRVASVFTLMMDEAVAQFDGRTVIGRITTPTLIVNETRDPFVPVILSREHAGGICGAKLILVDGDHLFARTQPDAFVGPATDFLAAVDTRKVNPERR